MGKVVTLQGKPFKGHLPANERDQTRDVIRQLGQVIKKIKNGEMRYPPQRALVIMHNQVDPPEDGTIGWVSWDNSTTDALDAIGMLETCKAGLLE